VKPPHGRTADAPQGIHRLSAQFPHTGRIERIFVRPARRTACIELNGTLAVAGRGLEGDRSHGGLRQLSLIQHEHLPVIAALIGAEAIEPALLRRNLVISGINLLALKPLGRERTVDLRIGDVIVRIGQACSPCSRMEEILGAGGYNAMRGHGGMLATILTDGWIKVGSEVRVIHC